MSIEPKDLATGEHLGQGFFEEMMRSVASMTQQEYGAGRITGDMYAQVYAGAMAEAMRTTAQFVVQYPVSNKQMQLIDAQIAATNENTELVKAQIRNMDADTLVKGKQLLLMDQQILEAEKRVELMASQIEHTDAQIELTKKQLLLMGEQILKTEQETLYTKYNALNTEHGYDTITKQQQKLDTEIDLLAQKVVTEKAQTLDTLLGEPIAGVVGKQKALIEAQTKGFHTDGLLKATKTYVDTWSLRQSTDGATADTAGLQDSEIARMLNALKLDLKIS